MNAELILEREGAPRRGRPLGRSRKPLYWVDLEPGRLHVFNPADGGDQAFDLGQTVSAVVPRARGGMMLALRRRLRRFRPATGQIDLWSEPEAHLSKNRFNDGKCDPAGRFWAGTLSLTREPGAASLYCLEPDGAVRTMLRGLTNSNGIAWSLDRATMYHIDTPTRRVTAFDYDMASGQIQNPAHGDRRSRGTRQAGRNDH